MGSHTREPWKVPVNRKIVVSNFMLPGSVNSPDEQVSYFTNHKSARGNKVLCLRSGCA